MNLRRAEDRLKTLRRRFGEAGLSFERIEGVDGRLLEQAELQRRVPADGRWGRLTAGEVGCFLSHRACWRAFLDAGIRHAAIFEDDVFLGENAAAVLGDDGWVPGDADIVKLETTASRVYLDTSPRGMIDGRRVQRLRSSHYCAAGYIVSRDCAERLLRQSETFCEALDDFLFSALSPVFSTSVVYQLSPAVCVQEWGVKGEGRTQDPGTSIEGREVKQRHGLPPARRLKEICSKESRSLMNKSLSMTGQRQRLRVEFR